MASVTGFNQLLQSMASADFFTGILPFLLSYVLFFLVVQRLPLIKKNDSVDPKKFSALISLIMAFFVANFLVQNPVYASYFTGYTGRIAVGMVGLLGFMLFMGLIGWEMSDIQQPILALLIILAVAGSFTLSGGVFAFLPGFELPLVGVTLSELINTTFETGLIWLIVVGGALYWVSSEGDGDSNLGWWIGMGDPEEGGTGDGSGG